MKYETFVSGEPLEVIRANECENPRVNAITVERFRRLWNEIEDLRAKLATRATAQQKLGTSAMNHVLRQTFPSATFTVSTSTDKADSWHVEASGLDKEKILACAQAFANVWYSPGNTGDGQ